MNNAWFQGVDWNIVLQKRIQPPWLPELSSDHDFQYFDIYPEQDEGNLEITKEEQKLFANF
jgi:hypothetical protein